jgi:MerR family transcriptional regulator, light-induced transcriptional regulator
MGDDVNNLRGALDAALRDHDRAGAVRHALAALDAGAVTVPELYTMLSAALVEVGAGWHSGTTEVWQEHLTTGIVRTIVEACTSQVEAAAPAQRPASVVLAAPDDEYHDLGLRMLADRFTLAGWRAHVLGANVPVDELIAAVAHLGADAVALSASTHFHRLRLRTYVDTLAGAHPQLTVWVGGPAFAYGHEGWSDQMILDPREVPLAGGAA